jgi:hypothetical protein
MGSKVHNGERSCAGKSKPPAGRTFDALAAGGLTKTELLPLLLDGSGGGLGGLRFHHALLEFIHTAGRIDKFLRAGIERVAGIADADNDGGFHRAGLDHVAARATDFRFSIIRMNVSFHNKGLEK